MENHRHNEFVASSKSVTKTMSTVPASVVAIIQLYKQPLFKFFKWSPIGENPNIAQKLAQRWNTFQHVFNILKLNFLTFFANKNDWWNKLHHKSGLIHDHKLRKLKFANHFIIYQKRPFKGRIVRGRLHSEFYAWGVNYALLSSLITVKWNLKTMLII